MVKRYLYHVCCHGNHCAISTTVILKTRYALGIACFIKQFVNSCLLHSLCSSIDVKLQETHRISKLLVLPSFNYSDLKTLTASTSKRHQQFYDVMFRLHQLHTFQTFISLLVVKIISSNFQEILRDTWSFICT